MPPKKLKDLSAAPVYTMAHEQQVRLLSDALLREYMHRRGYLATLKAFDEENPRDEETISSRALMSDLMALESSDQQRLKADGIETIMEMLCELRVEKRLEVQQLASDANAEPPACPSEEQLQQMKDEVTKLKQQKAAVHRDRPRSSSTSRGKASAARSRDSDTTDEDSDDIDDGDDDDVAERKRKENPKSKRHHKGSRSSGGEKKKKQKSRSSSHSHRGEAFDPLAVEGGDGGLTLDDLLGRSSDSDNDGPNDDASRERKAVGEQPPRPAGGDAAASKPSPASRKSTVPQAAAAEGAHGAPHPDSEDAGGSGDSGSDDATEDDADVAGGGGIEGGTPLDRAVAEEIYRILCGCSPSEAAPPLSFVQQGFAFDDSALDYALVQWRRGPGAVLAVVQSLILTFFYEKEVYVNVRTRQRDCLRRALSTILFRAQPNPASVILVNGTLRAKNPRASFAARMAPAAPTASSTFHTWSGFSSTEEVEEMLSEFLATDGEQWLSPKGSGLWSFLLSVCLSRGADALRKDLATGTGPHAICLIDLTSGDGRPELAHLMLTGRATPHAQPRGVAPQPSGLLNGDRKPFTDSGDTKEDAFNGGKPLPDALLNPGYPSWVVHHDGHYSNLFMRRDTRKAFRQKAALSGAGSVEMFYWDALTEDDEYALGVEVTSALAGHQKKTGQSARSAASYVTIAIQSVPEWKLATVDWNGETPLK